MAIVQYDFLEHSTVERDICSYEIILNIWNILQNKITMTRYTSTSEFLEHTNEDDHSHNILLNIKNILQYCGYDVPLKIWNILQWRKTITLIFY
jgi:hypothetical protein